MYIITVIYYTNAFLSCKLFLNLGQTAILPIGKQVMVLNDEYCTGLIINTYYIIAINRVFRANYNYAIDTNKSYAI